jgi:hypothetical protein
VPALGAQSCSPFGGACTPRPEEGEGGGAACVPCCRTFALARSILQLLLRDCAVMAMRSGMVRLINPVERAKPFGHADWLFEVT